MKIQIVGKNIQITDSIRANVEKKLARVEKYFVKSDEEILTRVVAVAYNVGAKIEITVFTKAMDFRTEVRDNDLYAAVDLAIDKLEDQMRRLKTRMNRSKNAGQGLGLGRAIAFENLADEDDIESSDEIVRTKSIYLEPMSLDDAITRMNALGHTFFVYLDEDDDKVAVAYKRIDGGYGVIETENELK